MDYDIHETSYGVEFKSVNMYSYAGNVNTSSANESFIADYDQKLINYFNFQKENSYVFTERGTAGFDSSGQFVVKGMYGDQPDKVRFENVYTLSNNGLLHQEGRTYDTKGKLISKWFFALKRDYELASK
jgi:hypothetical protein